MGENPQLPDSPREGKDLKYSSNMPAWGARAAQRTGFSLTCLRALNWYKGLGTTRWLTAGPKSTLYSTQGRIQLSCFTVRGKRDKRSVFLIFWVLGVPSEGQVSNFSNSEC